MGYIVLARKWRPQNFEDLIGQEAIAKTFKNALSGNKIVHAYLFSGPRGVGKTSSARILAKALNCEQRKESEPCGQCQSCMAVSEGASVDVFEIDGASNTSVESVRELRESVKYAPSGGKYKIYIIDEVHMLSTAAFNALLKTLEEPPAHVIFIFATTEPKKIPATILSRCQHHAFRRITREKIKNQLRKIALTEEIKIQESALEMLAKAADGSMRDALTLLDQAYSFSDDITGEELHNLLGLPETEIITNLSSTILTGDISKTLSIIKELTDRGSDLRQLTRELVEHFRNIAVFKVTEDAGPLLEFNQDEMQRLQGLAADTSIEKLTLLLTELLRLEGEVRNAINPRYTLELGLLRMSFIKGMASIEDILKMLGNAGPEEPDTNVRSPEAISHNIAPVTEKKPALPKKSVPSGGPGMSGKKELWRNLLDKLDSEDHLLACKVAEAKVINLDTTELAIGFNGGMSVLADSIKGKSPVIQRILKEISGHDLKLRILSLPADTSKNETKKIKEEVSAEPLVIDALRIFNGSLLKVKPIENRDPADETD